VLHCVPLVHDAPSGSVAAHAPPTQYGVADPHMLLPEQLA
jgi:hypothetical protein